MPAQPANPSWLNLVPCSMHLLLSDGSAASSTAAPGQLQVAQVRVRVRRRRNRVHPSGTGASVHTGRACTWVSHERPSLPWAPPPILNPLNPHPVRVHNPPPPPPLPNLQPHHRFPTPTTPPPPPPPLQSARKDQQVTLVLAGREAELLVRYLGVCLEVAPQTTLELCGGGGVVAMALMRGACGALPSWTLDSTVICFKVMHTHRCIHTDAHTRRTRGARDAHRTHHACRRTDARTHGRTDARTATYHSSLDSLLN